MICPQCKSNQDRVLDSREVDDGAGIRRRRECLECRARFTTYEWIASEMAMRMRKKTGPRKDYSDILALRAQGFTYTAIAAHVGLTKQRVWAICKQKFYVSDAM